jgi:hypothetical protein
LRNLFSGIWSDVSSSGLPPLSAAVSLLI